MRNAHVMTRVSYINLHRRERFYIETNECVNLYIPGRTPKEYRDVPAIKEKKAEYRAAHKEESAKYHKEYGVKHKEEIKAQKSIKVTCECGCSVQKGEMARHKRTKKHIRLMSQLQQSLKKKEIHLILI